MIDVWLTRFRDTWLSKDIEAVLSLFSDDVEYWETPYLKVGKDENLSNLWKEILPLKDMKLDLELVASDTGKNLHTVRWGFSHSEKESAGLYLVGLNDEGICCYFFMCSESKNNS